MYLWQNGQKSPLLNKKRNGINALNNKMLDEWFDRPPDSVYLIDPLTSNIVFCNHMGYEALLLQADEVLDHSVLTLQKDVSGIPAWEDIAEQLRQLKVFTFIVRHFRKDSSEFPV